MTELIENRIIDVTEEELILETRRNQNTRLLDDFIDYRNEGRKLYDAVFNYVRKRMEWNWEDAEDIMAEVQFKVWKGRAQYDPNQRLEPWIYTIATRTYIDYERVHKKRPQLRLLDCDGNVSEIDLEDYAKSPLETMELEEKREEVRRAASELPPYLVETIELVCFQELSYKEAGDILNVPEGTIKSRVNKAKALLENKLTDRRAA
ncbi:MAG: RNA polymerase sigma factor [Candidatus Nanoarchaeia archaeon]|nr:RNA polymerase sigma factor [Candidatus Nanoarchaeia archaeon]